MKTENPGILVNKKLLKAVFVLSVFVFLFYLYTIVVAIDVYKYAFVGAIFELLSIPVLLLLVAVPVLSIFQIIKYKKVPTWYTAGSLVFTAASIIVIVQSY